MFRNNYDNDATTFSPTGRIFQLEYACEAIKQGSATVGLRSNSHVVLVALKRNAEELGSYQKKIISLDKHMGVSLAGLAPDARVLTNYLRQQTMQEKIVYNKPLSVSKACLSLADKAQENTQGTGKAGRPYGVGFLVAGYDHDGPHLMEFLPTGSILEYYANAIGARSQAAKTYMEREQDKLLAADKNTLIKMGLEALRDTLPADKELNIQNTSVAIVGEDCDFTIYEDQDVEQWLNLLDTLSNERVRVHEEAAEAEDSD